MTDADRWRFWRERGATNPDAAELMTYAQSGFEPGAFERPIDCPLPDEPFVDAWERYAATAQRIGAVASLRQALMQLRFPIAEGMSENAAYLAAVRRGVWTDDPGSGLPAEALAVPRAKAGVAFVSPDTIRLFIHPTAAGRVPVIVAGAREDFESLVRAVTCRNEPRPIPPAMGACIVAGYNNWDRVAALGTDFPRLIGNKSLYQDRFIILSSGPYSGVPAADVMSGQDPAVDEAEWLRLSLTIRLEHECAHYVTRHALGTMRNSMLDELIADYAGIVAATGRYRAAWFLRFIGLDAANGCRAEGRIHTYRGTPPLSDEAFAILQQVIRHAAWQLEAFDHLRRRTWTAIDAARMIVALAKVGVEGLASDDAHDRIDAARAAAAAIVRDRTGSDLYRIEARR